MANPISGGGTGGQMGGGGGGTAPRNPGDEARPGSAQTGEVTCPACHGSGRLGTEPCRNCGGTGMVVRIVGDA